MAQGNYQNLLPLILKWEGGYSNHPADNGGETNYGVTWRRYNEYRKDKGLPQQSVKLITQDEVAEIYKDYYYDKVRGDELPPGLDYAMFDFAVNSGHSRAIKFVQGILGVKQDGVLGPETMNAIHRSNPQELASALNSQRLSWLKGLGDWKHFGAGWENRVNDVSAVTNRVAAEAIANGYTPPPPSTQSYPSDSDWSNPYTNKNLAMFGGSNGNGGFYHDWTSGHRWAHDNTYQDYSQHYREFTFQPKKGYIPVGERDGRTVYASPTPEYVNNSGVSRDAYVSEARRRGALIPTESEMRSLYSQSTAVSMPTSGSWGAPGGVGTTSQYNSVLKERLKAAGVTEGQPYYAGKEFYRADNAPAENWDVTYSTGPTQAEVDAGVSSSNQITEDKGLWGRLTDSLGFGDTKGVPEPIASPETSTAGGIPQARGVSKQQLVQDVVVPTLEEQRELGPEQVAPQVIDPAPQTPPPVPDATPQLPPPIQTTPPPMETPAVPDGVYVTPSSVPDASGSYTPPPPVTTETLPSPPETGGFGGSDFLSGIGGDLLKMGLMGIMGGGGGGMPLPPAPVVQAPPPPQIATGPVMFNIRKSKNKDKA